MNLQTWDPQAPAAGLYAMTAAQYHADPCPAPSLSAGTLIRLLDQSPAHARHFHPRLGGARDELGRKTEIGSAVHRLALLAGPELQVIEADSYRSKAAQEARQEAERGGRQAILAEDYAIAQAIAGPLKDAAEQTLGCKIEDAIREAVVIWQDGEFWRRAMIDAMSPDLSRRLDLKTTRGSAAPPSCTQRIFDAGYQLQAVHYTTGIDRLVPALKGRGTFSFLFVEVDAPHCISPALELSEGAWDIARQQHDVGSKLWDSCLKHDYWPAYDTEPLVMEPPPWYLTRWMARMNSDQTLNPVQPMEATAP
jgi:hypothetical protein